LLSICVNSWINCISFDDDDVMVEDDGRSVPDDDKVVGTLSTLPFGVFVSSALLVVVVVEEGEGEIVLLLLLLLFDVMVTVEMQM
jgi:hypothetical protein